MTIRDQPMIIDWGGGGGFRGGGGVHMVSRGNGGVDQSSPTEYRGGL